MVIVVIGRPKGRKNTIKMTSVFDQCELKKVSVILNSTIYLYDNLNLDLSKHNFAILYIMYAAFLELFNEKEDRNPILSISEFKKTATIIVIGTSKQNDDCTALTAVDVTISGTRNFGRFNWHSSILFVNSLS